MYAAKEEAFSGAGESFAAFEWPISMRSSSGTHRCQATVEEGHTRNRRCEQRGVVPAEELGVRGSEESGDT